MRIKEDDTMTKTYVDWRKAAIFGNPPFNAEETTMDDWEEEDEECPKCGHSPTRRQRCTECDDGWIDVYEEDPLWYSPGGYEMCGMCHGTGILRWCPNCGADLSIVEHELMEAKRGASDA